MKGTQINKHSAPYSTEAAAPVRNTSKIRSDASTKPSSRRCAGYWFCGHRCKHASRTPLLDTLFIVRPYLAPSWAVPQTFSQDGVGGAAADVAADAAPHAQLPEAEAVVGHLLAVAFEEVVEQGFNVEGEGQAAPDLVALWRPQAALVGTASMFDDYPGYHTFTAFCKHNLRKKWLRKIRKEEAALAAAAALFVV